MCESVAIQISTKCESIVTQTSTKCESVITQIIHQAPCVHEWKMGKNPKDQNN